MTAEQLAELSLVGKGALIAFFLSWICAFVSSFSLIPKLQRLQEAGLSVWTNPELRGPFLRFVGSCALGVVAGVVGFAFGGWPTR